VSQPVSAVYVYGVTRATSFPPVDGVDSAPVRTLAHEGLIALVSPIGRTELRAADLRAHWHVLGHVFEHGTVLPVRFGTVMESEDEVRRRLLDANRDRLTELLQTMDGLVQLTIKGRYDEDALLREIFREVPSVAALRDRADRTGALADKIALGERIEREIEARRNRDTAAVRAALDVRAVSAREEPVGHPDAFNVAFLVARAEMDAFGEAMPGVRAQFGDRIAIRYIGPAPPFSFADTELHAGTGAWA
jgi:hypothetical protein